MRVTFLSVSDQIGGSETTLVSMIEGLRRARPWWLLTVVLPGGGPLRARVQDAGARPVVVPFPAPLAALGESAAADAGWSVTASARLGWQLCRALPSMPAYERALGLAVRSSGPSVVHTNGFKGHVLGARLAMDVPLIWHLHEYVAGRRVTAALLRRYANRAAAIVANSASVGDDVCRTIPGAVVDVIPNAVDLDQFRPGGRCADLDAASGLPPVEPGTVRVGLVATFATWKGHDVFLQALAGIARERRVRGYVVGGPAYATRGSQHAESALRRRAADLGLADRVGFTGILPAAPALRALDVVVHASTRPEPFGLVIAEAMACGRAVVVSRAGGASELLEPEVDGLAHDPGDVDGLGRCLLRLIGDPALRARLGARARATAERRFDRGAMAEALAGVYERVGGGPARRCCA